jgi:hypothetical protein
MNVKDSVFESCKWWHTDVGRRIRPSSAQYMRPDQNYYCFRNSNQSPCGWGVSCKGWGIRIAAIVYPCVIIKGDLMGLNYWSLCISLHSSRLAGFNYWWCLKFVTPGVSENHLSCFGAIWPKLYWCAVKPNLIESYNLINDIDLLDSMYFLAVKTSL